MTEPTEIAEVVAPLKKRSFFKKAAWQTKVKADPNQDLFSHSNEFKDIIAEEHRRKEEDRKKKVEEKQRKADEERAQKRRRVSIEHEDLGQPVGRSSSSTSSGRKERKACVYKHDPRFELHR